MLTIFSFFSSFSLLFPSCFSHWPSYLYTSILNFVAIHVWRVLCDTRSLGCTAFYETKYLTRNCLFLLIQKLRRTFLDLGQQETQHMCTEIDTSLQNNSQVSLNYMVIISVKWLLVQALLSSNCSVCRHTQRSQVHILCIHGTSKTTWPEPLNHVTRILYYRLMIETLRSHWRRRTKNKDTIIF